MTGEFDIEGEVSCQGELYQKVLAIMASICRECLKMNPTERPTTKELLGKLRRLKHVILRII